MSIKELLIIMFLCKLLFDISPCLSAENWYKTAYYEDGNVLYTDLSSIKWNGNLVNFWTQKVYPSYFQQRSSEFSVVLPLSGVISKEHRLVDCANKMIASDQHIYYSSETGEETGRLVYPRPTFQPILSSSTMHVLWNYICNSKIAKV